MKYFLLLNIILFISFSSKSQTIIDSCFSSVDYSYVDGYMPDKFPNSEYIMGNHFWLAEWRDGNWKSEKSYLEINESKYINNTSPLPSSIKYAKAFYCGYSALNLERKEYFSLKLDAPLIVGKEYTYTFTYISNYMRGDKQKFSPRIRTNKKFNYKKSVVVGSLKPVGYEWETNTITFIATKKQKGHTWLILDVTDSDLGGQAGMILDMCTKVPQKNILLQKKQDSTKNVFKDLKIGESIILKNILFETGKSKLLEASFLELDELVKIFLKNNNLKVEIIGYTDNTGSKDANIKLSEDRAKVVVDYLIQKGVLTDKLISKGFGEEKPIANNDTEEGKSKNRRVEFRLLDK